mgnify:CR=1 FL=1
MPYPSPPRVPSGPRRRSLLASVAGGALLVGCSDGTGSGEEGTAGSPSVVERVRVQAARDSRGLVGRYDAVLAAYPTLAELKPAQAAHILQDFADDIVGLMLFILDRLDMDGNIRPASHKLCQSLRTEVQEEFTRHSLLERQRPVTFSDHTRGLSFDASVRLPRSMAAKGRRIRISLDALARRAGIRRPDIRRDPVHFKVL